MMYLIQPISDHLLNEGELEINLPGSGMVRIRLIRNTIEILPFTIPSPLALEEVKLINNIQGILNDSLNALSVLSEETLLVMGGVKGLVQSLVVASWQNLISEEIALKNTKWRLKKKKECARIKETTFRKITNGLFNRRSGEYFHVLDGGKRNYVPTVINGDVKGLILGELIETVDGEWRVWCGDRWEGWDWMF